MPWCSACGIELATLQLCPHHHASFDNWAQVNRTMCGILHRGEPWPRLSFTQRLDDGPMELATDDEVMARLRQRRREEVERQLEATRRERDALRQARRRRYYTLREKDEGRVVLSAFGQHWSLAGVIGQVLPGDVGKRVYLVNGVLQVESRAQYLERLLTQRVRRMKRYRKENGHVDNLGRCDNDD